MNNKYEISKEAVTSLFNYLEEIPVPHKYTGQIKMFLSQNLKEVKIEPKKEEEIEILTGSDTIE